jgi:hypothetical protein
MLTYTQYLMLRMHEEGFARFVAEKQQQHW